MNTSRLSPRDLAVIRSVRLLSQVTTAQLQRLHFSEPETSPVSRPGRTRRALRRLVVAGEIARVETRGIGHHIGGSDSYTYTPPRRTARVRKPHTVDVAELYVRLRGEEVAGRCRMLEFACENLFVEGRKNKVDAYVWLETSAGRSDWYIEVDRGSEDRDDIKAKVRAYTVAARKRNPFPRVLFVVTYNYERPLEDQVALIKSVIKRAEFPEMFGVCMSFDEAIAALCGP